MASQGEREPGVVGMCRNNLEAMVQDRIPVQDIPVQEQFFPQTDPEPEMGAAAAVEYDTSPSLLRNPPPIPAETAHPRASDMAQLCAMLAAMNANMETNLKENAKEMKDKMEEMRGEMQNMGRGLQAGIEAMLCDETRTAARKLRRHVLGRTSWGGVQRLSGPRWRRVRTG